MDFVLVTQEDSTQIVVPREALLFIDDDNATIYGHPIKIEGYNKNYGVLYDIATCQNKRRLQVALDKYSSKTETKDGKMFAERNNLMVPRQLFHHEPSNKKKRSTSLNLNIGPDELSRTPSSSSSPLPTAPTPIRTIDNPNPIGPDELSRTPSSSSSPLPTAPTPITTIDNPKPRTFSLPETIVEEVEEERSFSYGLTIDPEIIPQMPISVYKRRICNKPNICKFCKEYKTNIRRHITSMHRDEEQVKAFMMLNEDNPRKKEVLAQIRRDGNFEGFKENELVPCRISKHMKPDKDDYRVCPNCKILLKKDSLRRHLKKYCPNNPTKNTEGMLFRSKALSESIHKQANSTFRELIFPAFREGPVKEIIRFDKLLIIYANEMTCKYRSQHHFPMIRNRLIRMVKVFMMMKTKHPTLNSLKDILKPQMFDSILECINDMGQFSQSTGNYAKPTLPTEIGTALKYIIDLHISECIKSADEEGKSSAKNLLHLLKTALPAHVNKTAAESLLQLKRKKIVVLPSMTDIQKLNSYLLKQITYNYQLLIQEFNLDSWNNLGSCTLIYILVFNRRRPGELERSLITDLESLSGLSEDTDAFRKLNDTDREFVQEIKRFVIRGKLARGVPVLLNKIMFNSLNLIIKYRNEAGVAKKNPYIFGLPQNTETKSVFRHMIATNLIRKYSMECGASNPKTLRATTLRKHVATKSMSLNLNSEDIELLQGYLGHEDKIHREFYRQPVIERDILNISKVLRAAQTTSPDDKRPSSSRIVPSPSNAVQPNTLVLERATTPNSIPPSPVAGPSHAYYDPMRSGSEFHPSSDSSSSDDSIPDEVMLTPKKRRRRLIAMSPGQASVKRPWETPERHAAIKLFDDYLIGEKLPSTLEIEHAIKDCPELRNRTIPQIKLWVSNNKKSKRAKRVWGTPQKQVVKRVFKNFIEGEASFYPGKQLVEEMIQQHPEIEHLSPRRIRSQIQNQKKKFRQSLQY